MHMRDQKFPGLCIKFTIFMSFSMARFYFSYAIQKWCRSKIFYEISLAKPQFCVIL